MKINKLFFTLLFMLLITCSFSYIKADYIYTTVYVEPAKIDENMEFIPKEEAIIPHTIELEKSEKTFIDKVISNKWIVLFLSITIIIIFMIIIIRSAIKKRRYGR